MELKNLDRKPTSYEIIPKVESSSPIMVNARGTVNVPSFARLSPTEAQEVAMSILFAAALADLEGNLQRPATSDLIKADPMGYMLDDMFQAAQAKST